MVPWVVGSHLVYYWQDNSLHCYDILLARRLKTLVHWVCSGKECFTHCCIYTVYIQCIYWTKSIKSTCSYSFTFTSQNFAQILENVAWMCVSVSMCFRNSVVGGKPVCNLLCCSGCQLEAVQEMAEGTPLCSTLHYIALHCSIMQSAPLM